MARCLRFYERFALLSVTPFSKTNVLCEIQYKKKTQYILDLLEQHNLQIQELLLDEHQSKTIRNQTSRNNQWID
jgi:hypothetical protein